jgi:hypothetical protein
LVVTVLEEIDRIVSVVESTGQGRLVLVAGELAEALDRPEVLAGGFDVAGSRGDLVAGGERYRHPDELMAALRDGVAGGVVVLEDVDRALPPVRWCDLFLFRLLPPLLRESRLVVIATASSRLGADEGTDERIAELVEDGIVTTLTADRDEPTEGDEARAQLRGAFAHLGEAAASNAYDVAVRTLRVAALEGPEFTVVALARTLDVDEDALSDWLDDYLVVEDDRPDAPLEGLGFFEVDGGSLYRYGFRSRAFWTVMHPVYGAASWQASPPSRRLARRYADALAATYGPESPEAAFRLWDLAHLAGVDPEAYYASPVHATADVRDYVRLLELEEAAAGETREPRRLLASAQRIVRHLRRIAFSVPGEDLLRWARLSQTLLERAGDVPAEARIDAYSMLAVAARGQGWAGDTARCEALAIELLGPEHVHALVERLTGLATLLLEIAHQAHADTDAHLGLAVPWLDELLADREGLTGAAADLLQRAEAALTGLPAEERPHLQAHLHHAQARLEHAQGDPASAGRSEQRALTLLDQEAETPCNLRVLALLGLADHLEATGELQASVDAAREGTRTALTRTDANDVARAIGTLGRLALELAEPAEAGAYLAHSLVIRQGRDAWVHLGRSMARVGREPEALDCLALAAGAPGELQRLATEAGLDAAEPEAAAALRRAGERRSAGSELAFLEEITGIGVDQTNAFLAGYDDRSR